nr:2-dehydro-3-deoxygalactonokinase [Variovorax terrae]
MVAVDWGTSSLRGALFAPDGRVLEEQSFERGILTVERGGFATVFEACFDRWMRPPGSFCLISGMAGSQQGWREAPYCPCPAGQPDVAARLTWIEPGRIALVPGLSCEHGGVPDVMRGEETQVFGALQLLGLNDGLLVLPGTHSKWVRVRAGRIENFATFMTGEFYALLRQHSILARTLPADDAEPDDDAFAQGVARALQGPGLLHSAFSTRTLSLFNRMAGPALASYLSGLVIGEELRAQPLDAGSEVIVIGAPALTRRYALALPQRGLRARCLGPEATWCGLRALANTLHQDAP